LVVALPVKSVLTIGLPGGVVSVAFFGPNTHVDLLDKDNHVIGSGTTDSNGRVTITPTVPIINWSSSRCLTS
jgi:hypothetical protein